MKILLHTPIVLAILISCGQVPNENKKGNNTEVKHLIRDNSKLTEINVKFSNEDIFIDTILTRPRIIKLETNNSCLIGNIDKILFDDSLIFVVDRTISQAIFIYNFSGKLQGKISQRGKGPKEFIGIWDATLIPERKQVALLDLISSKVNYYSYEGEFETKKRLPFQFNGFTYIDLNTIAYYTGRSVNRNIPSIDNHKLVIASDKNEITSKSTPLTLNQINGKFSYETQFAPLWKFGNKVYYNPNFSDTIYRIAKDSLIGEYYFNMNGENIPNGKKNTLDDYTFNELAKKYSFINGDFIALDDYLYIAIARPAGYHYLYYSKKTGRVISGDNYSMSDPLFSFLGIPRARYDKNTIVASKQPQEILNYQNHFKHDSHWKEDDIKLKSLFENLKESDNPVLFFYTFKSF